MLACGLGAGVILDAQARRSTRRATPRKPAAVALKTEAAKLTCPALLGRGVRTRLEFCDVLISRQPADGVLITIPPHEGPAFVTFSLHNRHTYSDEEVRAKRAYASYTAVVGLLTMDAELVERAAVQAEFFAERDLFDRIEGGAGPRGLKAVAPIGAEHVRLQVDAATQQASLLGEKLVVVRREQTATYTVAGTPIATVSDVQVQYRPKRAPARRR
ncbi:MAG: hypothetical protein HYU53_17390 [Acidobacteria bacterium]|nr:hypothetical protein [Acidobacteriota bacterium]